MILKTKKINDLMLVLKIEKRVYSIEVQKTKKEYFRSGYTGSVTRFEILEEYGAADFELDEVVDYFNAIYELLK